MNMASLGKPARTAETYDRVAECARSIAQALLDTQYISEKLDNHSDTPAFTHIMNRIQEIFEPSLDPSIKARYSWSDFNSLGGMLRVLEEDTILQIHVLLQLPPPISRLKHLSKLYRSTFHELDFDRLKDRAFNWRCHDLANGNQLSQADLVYIANGLHRQMINIFSQANIYKSLLGEPLKTFPWCHDDEIHMQRRAYQCHKDTKDRYKEINDMIRARHGGLFDIPSENAWWLCDRGANYLTMALSTTSWSMARIAEVLTELALAKKKTDECFGTSIAKRILEDKTVNRILDELRQLSEPSSSSSSVA